MIPVAHNLAEDTSADLHHDSPDAIDSDDSSSSEFSDCQVSNLLHSILSHSLHKV
jgi:hypothetical protein